MFRLAHLSDIHLGPLPEPTLRELASKRITGYVNWRRNRARQLAHDTLALIAADISAQSPDHVALTGDLVNLALDEEIAAATRWLEDFGSPTAVSVVPGNHDAYVPGALAKACRAWHPWMCGDGDNRPAGASSFPYMRVRGPVALIGVSSARATAPFLATGHFRGDQAARLFSMLEDAGRRGLFRVVMIHHPPIRNATAAHKRLFGISLFQKTIAEAGAELVLHGHTHLPTVHWIDGAGTPVPVIGVPAAGQGVGGHKPPGGWNLFGIERATSGWSVTLTRRGVTGPSLPVRQLAFARVTPDDLPGPVLPGSGLPSH